MRATAAVLALGLPVPCMLAPCMLALCLPGPSSAADPASASTPSAEALVEQSIAYHDPEGLFLGRAHRLRFRETRPGQSDRRAEIVVDVPGRHFEMLRADEAEVRGTITGDGPCETSLDGQPASRVSAELRQRYRLDCDRFVFMRDYYTYLWGLPMKLRDPGTHLGEVVSAQLEGEPVWRLKVTYDEAVGTDVWYFDFDPETHAMVGYRFYRDETETQGEIIGLEGEVEAHGLRLPAERAWIEVPGDRYLGTDILVELEPLP